MDILFLLLIAIGLSFDTFAVSIIIGLSVFQIKFWQASKIALTLTVFQCLMPILGWVLGSQINDIFSHADHWIAFGLLSIIGIKMIIEGFKKEGGKKEFDPFKPLVLIGIAIATSIDALIVGVSFAFINVNILLSAGIIGFTTYISAMLGMLFGKTAGKSLGKNIEMAGGIILLIIGIKILFEHSAI